MSWITRVLQSNHCHQRLQPIYTMTTSGSGWRMFPLFGPLPEAEAVEPEPLLSPIRATGNIVPFA